MKLVLHGILADQFGKEHTIITDRVADAIEGLSVQMPGWPRKMLIQAVGFDTESKLRDRTDVEVVHLVPSLHGGGGKFGSIILGAALVAASFALPALGLIAAHGALASGLTITGGLMVIQGVFNLFLKSPKAASNPDASNYLGNSQNTTAIGTPIPLAWGRIQLAGQWLGICTSSSNLTQGVWPVNPT